jgi:hypothetical protein
MKKIIAFLKSKPLVVLNGICIILCIVMVAILINIRLFEARILSQILESEINTTEFIQTKTKEIKEIIDKHDERSVLIISLIEEQNKETALFESEYKSDIRSIQNNFSRIFNALAIQLRLTEGIETTYSDLLEEQKKRTVDESAKDLDIEIMRGEAYTAFKNENYKRAYDLFSNVQLYQKDNLDVRFYRIYSLFLVNRMDTGKYKMMLDELAILRLNGYTDERVDEMAEHIEQEMKAMR